MYTMMLICPLLGKPGETISKQFSLKFIKQFRIKLGKQFGIQSSKQFRIQFGQQFKIQFGQQFRIQFSQQFRIQFSKQFKIKLRWLQCLAPFLAGPELQKIYSFLVSCLSLGDLMD